jgi:heme-degrading monooxygenase HmoA
MFAVIFEVRPKRERWDDYLSLAKQLKPKLEAIDGFIDNERFKSRRDAERLLSLSIWRDEKALVRWRTHGEHHIVQEKGRFEVFEDYHLRVGQVVVDSDPPRGLPVEPERLDETETGGARAVTITEMVVGERGDLAVTADRLPACLGLDPARRGLIDQDAFESIYQPRKLLLLSSWLSADAAASWSPAEMKVAESLRHRRVRIIRDYGMFERREAPQFYPEVTRRTQARDEG